MDAVFVSAERNSVFARHEGHLLIDKLCLCLGARKSPAAAVNVLGDAMHEKAPLDGGAFSRLRRQAATCAGAGEMWRATTARTVRDTHVPSMAIEII